MKLPWPENDSHRRPDESIRRILDYLVWICGEMRQPAYPAGLDQKVWRRRVGEAYLALFLPPVAGHGDPYPPDIPPAETPGAWPDIPAEAMSGMTVRHQLKVMELLALELRDRLWAHGRGPEFQEWDRRLCDARTILDHGEAFPMPEDARTQPSEAAMAEAQAQETARKALVRKRERRLRRLARQSRSRTKNAAKETAKGKAKGKASGGDKKASRKKPATKKATRKQATKKAAAGKKARTKATTRPSPKKKTAKKKAARKTTSKKKAARKGAAKKKAASKSTPRKRAAKNSASRKSRAG